MKSLLEWMPPPDSRVQGNAWPVVLGPQQAVLLDLLRRVDASQWWPAHRLEQGQMRQAAALINFAARQVPFYRKRIQETGIETGTRLDMEAFRRIPILKRSELQTENLFAKKVPPGHGRVSENKTSGSTGSPVTVRMTQHYQHFYRVLCARDHHWHGRDPDWKLASIRHSKGAQVPKGGQHGFGWLMGRAWSDRRSPSCFNSIELPISRQAEWLGEEQPDMLITYPSNFAELARHCSEKGIELGNLKQVVSIGEMLTPNARKAVADHWGVPLIDLYSSEEVGYLASQCPESGLYHTHSESVIVEVLDEDDRQCAPGQTGRVVITGLHNYATPLIRYEIRDWAEVGEPCDCGRGLPVLRRIVGRERNMLVLPDGERRWPLTGYQGFGEVITVRQFQFVQRSAEQIEVRLVADRTATAADEAALTPIIHAALGHQFELKFVWMDDIPVGPNGKFEEFISEVR